MKIVVLGGTRAGFFRGRVSFKDGKRDWEKGLIYHLSPPLFSKGIRRFDYWNRGICGSVVHSGFLFFFYEKIRMNTARDNFY